MDVIAETSVQVTNQAQTFRWEGYGLRLHVPQGALPDGLEKCRLFLKVGLWGQFSLPSNIDYHQTYVYFQLRQELSYTGFY